MSPVYDGLSIVNEYNDFYQEAYYAWNAFYPLEIGIFGFFWENNGTRKSAKSFFKRIAMHLLTILFVRILT